MSVNYTPWPTASGHIHKNHIDKSQYENLTDWLIKKCSSRKKGLVSKWLYRQLICHKKYIFSSLSREKYCLFHFQKVKRLTKLNYCVLRVPFALQYYCTFLFSLPLKKEVEIRERTVQKGHFIIHLYFSESETSDKGDSRSKEERHRETSERQRETSERQRETSDRHRETSDKRAVDNRRSDKKIRNLCCCFW